MIRDWNYFTQWELSDGNKWTPLAARGLRKAWKYSVQGELKKIIPGGNDRLVAFSGKDTVTMLDLTGREVWKTALFEGGPPMKDYRFPPYMIDGAWFYRETLFAQMAGVAPIQLDPLTGAVVRRSRFPVRGRDEISFNPDENYSDDLQLIQRNWVTPVRPGISAIIARSGLLEQSDVDSGAFCLGWRGYQAGMQLIGSLARVKLMDKIDFMLDIIMIVQKWVVFRCYKNTGARCHHLRIARNGDYFGAIVVSDAVDAFITGQGDYVVTKHHDEGQGKWWIECRSLNDPQRVLWKTEACRWMTWFMGTGDTVWNTEWCGPGSKVKDWLVGRDLVTGTEIYRKAEACRLMGSFCGPLLITASGRSITAWEPVA